MEHWRAPVSDKAWDFNENEAHHNVVFLDSDSPPHPNISHWGSSSAATAAAVLDIQNLELKDASTSNSEELPDGFGANFGEYWVPAPNPEDLTDDDDDPPIRKIFVGNLPYRVTDAKLKVFFGKFGKVISAHVKREPAKRRNSFYGFVTFHRPAEAKLALRASPKQLHLFGYQLTVSKANAVHQPIELPDGTVQWLPGKRFNRETGELIYEARKSEQVVELVDEYNEAEPSPFATLNDDCLLHIFSFLSLTDRIRVERVCKQWQCVGRSMWRRMRALDMRLLALPAHHLHSMGVLRSILQRCGESLTCLSLAIYAHSRHRRSKFLPLVGALCPNLQELDAAGVRLNRYGLQKLGAGCTKLRRVNLDNCSGVDERFLDNLLRFLPDLESLSLAGWGDLTGRALLKLPAETMRELNLNSCSNLRPNELLMAVKRLPSLESLSLTSCISLSNQHVKLLCETVPQLRALNMAQYFPRLKYTSLESISILTGLQSLNLELNDLLTDTGLDAIVNGCKDLKYLNITGCRAFAPEHVVTTRGIKSLAKLPSLKELRMSYLANIDDSALCAIAQNGILRKLECRGCPSLKGEGFKRIIMLCPDLNLCDVSGCDNVKISVVKTAVSSMQMRSKNLPLRLIVGGTSIQWEQVEALKHDFDPMLSVDLVDLSVPHLRPDFVDGIYFNDFSDYSDGDVDEADQFDDLCAEDYEFFEDLALGPVVGYISDMDDCVWARD